MRTSFHNHQQQHQQQEQQQPQHCLLESTMENAPRWSTADDKKLAELFRKNKNLAINLDTKSVQNLHRAHFSDRKFPTFSSLFCRKARQWQVNQTLNGKRSKY
jgi:hypothetical protein